MTILVTGATGTVGFHVVQQLVNKHIQVRALTRNPDNADLPTGVDVVKGDLNDPDTLINALKGVEGLFLIVSSDKPEANLQTNPKVIELAESAGVRKICLLVGFEEGPVEEALKNSVMKWTLLKPTEFMANALDDWQETIRTDRVVREFQGEALSARVHEADIAAVAVTSLLEGEHHGQSYHLTGPEAISRADAVSIISEGIGKDIQFIELSEDKAKKKWEEQGYGEEDIEFFILMGKNPPEAGYRVVSTIEQVTGRPAKTFAEWVSEHKRYFL